MEDNEKKNTKIGFGIIALGILLLAIGVFSLGTKIYKIIEEPSIYTSFEMFIPGIILIFFGSFMITIGMNIKNLPNYFGKLAISISAFLLSGAMILLALNTEVTEITENVQPTLDTIIVDYIQNENGTEIEILQSLLNTTNSFETLEAAKLTMEQETFMIEAFKINQIIELDEQEKKELPSKIISSIYNALKSQNQEELLTSPLPITEIIKFLETTGNLELTLLSMSYLTEIENKAKLIIMIPSEIQNENSIQNLEHLRNQCDELDQNQICDAFTLSEYENLISYIATNESLPIEINLTGLESINTIEKLETELDEKTNYYQLFFLGFIFFLLLGYIILNKENSKKYKKPSLVSFKEINKIILKYFLLPTIVICILYILFKTNLLIESFQKITQEILGEELPINLISLPIIENVSNIVTKLLVFHISIVMLSVSIYFLLKDKIHCLITNELV
jgi:hypothetical protein